MPQDSFVQLARRKGTQVGYFLYHTRDVLSWVELTLEKLCEAPGVNLQAEFKTENEPTSLQKLREDTPRISAILKGLEKEDAVLLDGKLRSQVHKIYDYAFQLMAAAENNAKLGPAQALDLHARNLQTCLLGLDGMAEAFRVGRHEGIEHGKSRPKGR